ncbi:HD domain-containing protein [Proteinivorax tanatarense]|uniref:HD domain-containing protein n=1 Tax=Proteinivorax tanatarense TaxID=1260629 RepID=A0AAU7VLS4_9FIRM
MNVCKAKEIAYENLREVKYKERETGYLFYHGERVANLAIKLTEKLGGLSSKHKDRLYLAAIFHDVAKGREPHNFTGAVLTKKLLKNVVSKNELEEIAKLIYYHNKRENRSLSLPAKVLQDADIIDHTGTLDVWLGMHYVVSEDLSPKRCINFFLGGKWNQMVEQQRQKLNYNISKNIYNRRVLYAERFFKKMAWEMGGNL